MFRSKAIEAILLKEIHELCISCAHADTCRYRKSSTKIIIQCELYELDKDQAGSAVISKGLCENCDHAATCTLPGRRTGVWHCNEYQ